MCGDAPKAISKLGWRARTRFRDLIRIMLEADILESGLAPERYLMASAVKEEVHE